MKYLTWFHNTAKTARLRARLGAGPRAAVNQPRASAALPVHFPVVSASKIGIKKEMNCISALNPAKILRPATCLSWHSKCCHNRGEGRACRCRRALLRRPL